MPPLIPAAGGPHQVGAVLSDLTSQRRGSILQLTAMPDGRCRSYPFPFFLFLFLIPPPLPRPFSMRLHERLALDRPASCQKCGAGRGRARTSGRVCFGPQIDDGRQRFLPHVFFALCCSVMVSAEMSRLGTGVILHCSPISPPLSRPLWPMQHTGFAVVSVKAKITRPPCRLFGLSNGRNGVMEADHV